ncbi:hypothetical protein DY000_02056258, partial [Brassica cretica]
MSSVASLKLSPSSPVSIPKALLLQNRQEAGMLLGEEFHLLFGLSNLRLPPLIFRRRRVVVTLGVVAPWISLLCKAPVSFGAESKKGFMTVSDNKDAYSFLYPFGWQEVVIEGQDKIAETLILKVSAPPNQKTTLIDASE